MGCGVHPITVKPRGTLVEELHFLSTYCDRTIGLIVYNSSRPLIHTLVHSSIPILQMKAVGLREATDLE